MSEYLEINGLFDAPKFPNAISSIDFSNLEFTPYEVDGRKGVAIHKLYDTSATDAKGPAAAIVRYAGEARTPRHLHPGWEMLLVLSGELIDDRGRHSAGTLHLYPPGSSHELSSDAGCTFLVVWEQPVKPIKPNGNSFAQTP